MSQSIRSVITGTGNFIPPRKVKNEDFLTNEFYESRVRKLDKSNQEIIDKFLEITTIAERRFVDDDLNTSDIAHYAAIEAINSADIDQEELDYIIVAHNFGDVRPDNRSLDIVPSLASRVKHKLRIKNPKTVAYDITFGCPGWLQGVIQADYFIRSGDAQKILVIGADVLSRVSDPHDRDSMLYADGAGATVLEADRSDSSTGILSHHARSDTYIHSEMLYMGDSYKPENDSKDKMFLKMNGRRLYQYALENVPQAIKECLEKADIHLNKIKKILIHQANGKMDAAILKRLYALYGLIDPPDHVMPMSIDWLGNSSVATIPTLLDLILNNKLDEHQLNEGDIVVFASVGAGMNINAVTYKM